MKNFFPTFLVALQMVACSAPAQQTSAVKSSQSKSAKLSYLAPAGIEPAYREPNESSVQAHDEWLRTNGQAGLALTSKASESVTAEDGAGALEAADLSQVPTWSDAQLAGAFSDVRDLRAWHAADKADFARRLSWLFPDDGCYARAQLMDQEFAAKGLKRPYKVFVFGDLTVQTPNGPDGKSVTWRYHVAPIVRDEAGEAMVIDPAIDPTGPLKLKDWLGRQTNDLSTLAVNICSANAYHPGSECHGAANADKVAQQTLEGTFLPAEWSRQQDLGNEPTQVLGELPPWATLK